MLILITYDVNTATPEGRKRLNKLAKVCVDYGQRVQYSVFECIVDPAQYVQLKKTISTIIDKEKDSIRFYLLGKNWNRRIEHLGKNETYHPTDDLFII
ncbi:MAG: CRISPR-associated endonuclease Cas2 [Bacilli bacterium]|nr:CRISPR-associated endonuclease Cas2 [Bacilli bacterium]